MDAPGVSLDQLSRGQLQLQMIPPHEAVDDTLRADQSAALRLDDACSAHELPPSYYEHPLVLQHGRAKVWPLALFADGVAYSHVDAAIGFWFEC